MRNENLVTEIKDMDHEALLKRIRELREARVLPERTNKAPKKRQAKKTETKAKDILAGLSDEERARLLKDFGGGE